MEHTEFSSMCSSVGELNKGECFCKGAGELHCAGTPTAVTSPHPSCTAPPCEKTLPVLWTLHKGTAKHWPKEQQLW